ncbi:hypothetical protein [Francisella tularensis]|uniref:hypothetical protein n=1 Tax=Francisella tularensis TaxID=263 RepID=UPI0005AD54B9|nr:hypothetical protein [Francisella tularensis]AJJ46849.1 hypothetical protein CH70_1304 [Francisella tularensis subsp. novicida]
MKIKEEVYNLDITIEQVRNVDANKIKNLYYFVHGTYIKNHNIDRCIYKGRTFG